MRYIHILVVEPEERDGYRRCRPYKTVLTLPKCKRGIGFARRVIENFHRVVGPQIPQYFALDDSVWGWKRVDIQTKILVDCSFCDVLGFLVDDLRWRGVPTVGFHRLRSLGIAGSDSIPSSYARCPYRRRHVASAMLINSQLVTDFPFDEQHIWEDLSRNFRLSGGTDPDGKPPEVWSQQINHIIVKYYGFAMVKKRLTGGCASFEVCRNVAKSKPSLDALRKLAAAMKAAEKPVCTYRVNGKECGTASQKVLNGDAKWGTGPRCTKHGGKLSCTWDRERGEECGQLIFQVGDEVKATASGQGIATLKTDWKMENADVSKVVAGSGAGASGFDEA
jgi:hypothetical protein